MTGSGLVIVDYGVGNVGSLVNMFSRIGTPATVSGDAECIENAGKIVLPGVGAFDHAAKRLRETGLDAPIISAARQKKTPLLGVCLGMQLLLDGSEEGVESGLGLIPGHAYRFPSEYESSSLNVPHMGWNALNAKKPSKLLPNLAGNDDRYYFTHSYFVVPDDTSDMLASTTYGVTFASAIERDNVVGVQFHPEKSHRFGLRLLSDFANN